MAAVSAALSECARACEPGSACDIGWSSGCCFGFGLGFGFGCCCGAGGPDCFARILDFPLMLPNAVPHKIDAEGQQTDTVATGETDVSAGAASDAARHVSKARCRILAERARSSPPSSVCSLLLHCRKRSGEMRSDAVVWLCGCGVVQWDGCGCGVALLSRSRSAPRRFAPPVQLQHFDEKARSAGNRTGIIGRLNPTHQHPNIRIFFRSPILQFQSHLPKHGV